MLSCFNKETWYDTTLEINGSKYYGISCDMRIDADTIPKGLITYSLRHSDDDWGNIAAIKSGFILVNHYGTFCTKTPIPIAEGEEVDVTNWRIDIP